MNNSKLEKLLNSPTREGMRDRLKAKSEFWDYKDKRCRFHRRDYGQGYEHANKLFEKNIGQSFHSVVKTLKNDPRYKYMYFFRRGVNETIEDVKNNSFSYLRFDSDYYLDNKSNTVHKRPTRKRYKFSKQNNDALGDCIYTYKSRVEIHRREGIHYFLIERSYWEEYWHPVDGIYHKQIPDKFEQLSKYWLKWFQLENLAI